MTLPMLAPRPREPVTSITPGPQPALMYTESEWAVMYPEIERLYVRERRKLREQMYKKRFAKWGFQKYSRRSAAAEQTSRMKDGCRKCSPPGELGSMPAFPRFSQNDGLKLMFLTSVQTWGVAFFEFLQSGDGFLASQQRQPPVDQLRPVQTIEISFAFKLVIDLLDRGHGELAGRMARKAFLLVEDMLALEGPALIWNLLEMMHNMVILRHVQLFRMLLAHLIALVNGRMPEAHPLSAMLRSLQGFVANLTSAASNTSSSSPSFSSSSWSSSTGRNRTMAVVDHWLLSRALPSLLEQAWIFNAKILFDHFDPGLLHIYCRIFWDSCSINLPTAIIDTTVQWLSHIKAQQKSSAAEVAYLTNKVLVSNPIEEHRMLQRLLSPRSDASPPQDYEMLRVSSIAALQERRDLILSKGLGFNGNTTIVLRILAALVTAKVLEEWPTVMERSSTVENIAMKVPRIYAGNAACAIRALMDLNIESGGGLGASLDTIERIRSIVALREYAEGETNPQVMREMWLLEDALIAAGEYGEAQEVRQDVYRRLEMYVQDIPIGSV
ncbi:hypothetical protein B7463_g573, partial [Scytalidium lignicola]